MIKRKEQFGNGREINPILMRKKLNIIGINGRAGKNASNLSILKVIPELGKSVFNLNIIGKFNRIPTFQNGINY